MILVSATGATAQTREQNRASCNSGTPDLQIAGCTALIQAGQENADDLTSEFNNLGNAYNRKGDLDRAIANYDQAIRYGPQESHAYNNRGRAYALKHDYDRAIADFSQAMRLEPSYTSPYSGRALAYLLKGDFDRALADADQYIKLEPQNPNATALRQQIIDARAKATPAAAPAPVTGADATASHPIAAGLPRDWRLVNSARPGTKYLPGSIYVDSGSGAIHVVLCLNPDPDFCDMFSDEDNKNDVASIYNTDAVIDCKKQTIAWEGYLDDDHVGRLAHKGEHAKLGDLFGYGPNEPPNPVLDPKGDGALLIGRLCAKKATLPKRLADGSPAPTKKDALLVALSADLSKAVDQTPDYRKLVGLIARNKADTAWKKSAQGIKAFALQKQIRADAAGLAIAQGKSGPMLQYSVRGGMVSDANIRVSDLKTDPTYRSAIVKLIADTIISNNVQGFLNNLPPVGDKP